MLKGIVLEDPSEAHGHEPPALYGLSDLKAQLALFEGSLRSGSPLSQSAIHSYVDQAGRFLRWIDGSYTPHGAVPELHPLGTGPWSLSQLRDGHAMYRGVLDRAGLSPLAIQTYISESGIFLRWLAGEYRPRTDAPTAGHSLPVKPINSPTQPLHLEHEEPVDEWLWEGRIQAAVVKWLTGRGWEIEREANTKSKEQGVDIVAVKGARRLVVEVKGYPQTTYRIEAKRGELKKYHAGSQSRTYFAGALMSVLYMRDSMAGTEVALALPSVPSYLQMVQRTLRSLGELGIGVYFAAEDGTVVEYLAPRKPREHE